LDAGLSATVLDLETLIEVKERSEARRTGRFFRSCGGLSKEAAAPDHHRAVRLILQVSRC
jgi:hypothetical protein